MKVLILKQADLKEGLEEANKWLKSFTDLELDFTIKEVKEKLRKQTFLTPNGKKVRIYSEDIILKAEKGYDIVCFIFNPDLYNATFTPVHSPDLTMGYTIIQLPVLPVSSSKWIAEYFWHEMLHAWYYLLNYKGFYFEDDVHQHAFNTPNKSYKDIVNKLKPFLHYIMSNKPEYIIVHHTAVSRKDNSNQYDAVRQYHINKGWGDIGYHWFIEPDGTLKQGRQENQIGAHTIGYNDKSIGVALAGNFDKELPTKKQEATLKEILIRISKQYKISSDKIVPHRAFAKKTCYGSKLSDDWAKNLINNMKLQLVQKKGEKDVYIMYPIQNGYELFKITNSTFLKKANQLGWIVGWDKIWVVNSFDEIEGSHTFSDIEFAAIKE